MFRRLEQIEYRFDLYIWDIARETLAVVKAGYPSTIVRLLKLIEYEELCDSPSGEDSYKAVKGYRIKYFDVLREKIIADMNHIYTENQRVLRDVLPCLSSVVDELTIVHDEVTPLFPQNYNILNFFVLEYHRAIYDLINRMTVDDIDPADILLLTKWVRDYYASMGSRLGVTEDLLEPRLLDGREDELICNYVKLVRTKLAEWLVNIMHSETLEFLERKISPETDANGQFLLTGSVIIFQMFNQQLDIVSTASYGQLIADVINECCEVLNSFQNGWMHVLDSEYSRFVSRAADMPQGLVEYTIALGNDCVRSAEFGEAFILRIEGFITAQSCLSEVVDKVKASLEGFMKLSRRTHQILVDIVISDVSAAFKVMHCDAWYDQDVLRLILGTFEDYSDDFIKHMSEYLFNKITTELIEKFLVLYLDSFRNKNAKFKMPIASERIRNDIEKCVNYFSKIKTPKRVLVYFESVRKVVALLDSNPRMIYLDFHSLWRAFPDISLDYVEKVLSKRDDLDKSQLKELIETCKSRLKDEVIEEFQPTVFSKLYTK